MFNPVTWDAHTFPVYFGGTVVNDDGIIISVPSLQLAYFVNADTNTQDARYCGYSHLSKFKHYPTQRLEPKQLLIASLFARWEK